MKTLTLIIKQCFFDEIIKGTKKQEFREVKPTTFKRLVQLDEDGYELEDENGNAIPIHYDALQLYVGYAKNRASALVEVKSAYCEIITNEKGERYNIPNQRYVEQGLFELKKGTRSGNNGVMYTTITTKVTGKGQIYFVNKFKVA